MQEVSQSKKKTSYNMLTDHPGKALVFFAMPMILGNLFQQFYNIMDSVIVGKFVSEEALASVGASYSITNVFIAVAIGGGVGSSVVISQFLGAKQYQKMKTAISTTLINFMCISLCLGIIGLFMNDSILRWMNTPGNVFKDAAVYLKIYFIGLPFLFMYNVQASVFNSLGDSKTPLYLLIFSSLLNIVLDLVFVIQFHMGVAGVAVATLLAQGVSAVISFFILIRKVKAGFPGEAKFPLYDVGMMAAMVKVAVPSTLQQSIVHIGILLVQSVVNGFGSAVMAGYSAATRIESISIVPMLAMGNAMSTFSAQNMGAKNPNRVRKGYKICYGVLAIFAVILCAVIQFGKTWILSAFLEADAGSVAFQTGVAYASFISYFFILIGLKSTTDGLLRGAGDVVVFTFANLANLAIRVFVAFHFAPIIGVQAVWYAVPIGWAANYIISFGRYLTGKWSEVKLIR